MSPSSPWAPSPRPPARTLSASRSATIRASQVGTVSPARSARRTTADRLALSLELLRDPALDALLTGASAFCDLPEVMAALTAGRLPALCHTITYDGR